MYKNQHAILLASLERNEKRLREEILIAENSIVWFEGFESEPAYSALSHLKRETTAAREKLGEIEKEIEANSAQLQKANKAAAPGFFGRFYTTTERSVAIRLVRTLKHRSGVLSRDKAKLKSELGAKEAIEQSLATDIERYRAFDPLETRAFLAHVGAELQQVRSGVEHAGKASERWEAAAGEVAREYENVKRKISTIESDLLVAESFERALAAGSPRERAKIHLDCEARFGRGNGSPAHVLRESKATHRKLGRDAEKLKRRLEDVIRILDKKIGKLVLDGNNLCYATTESGKGRFVGVEPLKALVPRLCETYTVELFFDPGIRRQLQVRDSDLRALFPNVRIEVMARDKADLAILAAAEFDEHAYIVSNDRFADFPDKEPVKNNRIFKHIIHGRSIQIQALDLNVSYPQETVPA